MIDEGEPDAESLSARAAETEDAARAVAGVTNSEGADTHWVRTDVLLAATNGFQRSWGSTRHSLGVSVLAGEGTGMERDYDHAMSVHGTDLRQPADIGRTAGERAVQRLNPRKAASAQVPVVYDSRVAGSLLGHLSMAINGQVIARGTSFLKDSMGEAVFAPGITVVDDPRRARGLRSRAFDGEGIATRARNLIDDGVLSSWILDLRSARKLGLETTGHAARDTASPPSPSATNFYMEPGRLGRAELMADIKSGFYVTELIGFGINMVTGDYSRGASGMWIENGELAYPVSEVTVAGNLSDMFKNLTPADDLEFRYGTDAPTLRVEGMTVAGV